jgi:hypothetical protein
MPNKTTNTKPKLERIYTCTVCSTSYTTPRYSATPICSPKCRSSLKRKNIADKRILSLPQCDEWLWVCRELKRVGTIEALQGVDLVELFSLYRSRFKCYGWNAETKQSKYHLCHISSAKGKDSIGLLSHLNLFIGNSLPNQIQGNKEVKDRGLSISRHSLKRKWLVSDKDTDRQVLDKVVLYLGAVLVEYAKTNPIRKSQRFSLARWIYQNIPTNTTPLKELERLGLTELRTMRAKFEEKALYMMDLVAKRSIVVALDESQRLSDALPDGQHKDDLVFMLPVLRIAGAWMSRQPGEKGQGLVSILSKSPGVVFSPLQLKEGKDESNFRDFISFQAFNALQGHPVDRNLIKNTLRSYLSVKRLTPEYMDYEHRLTLLPPQLEERQVFFAQISTIRTDILSFDLASKVVVSTYFQEVNAANAEQDIFNSFNYDTCSDQYDYSGLNIQVEDDYIPNPFNRNLCLYVEQPIVDF